MVNVVTGFGAEAGSALVDRPDACEDVVHRQHRDRRAIAATCGERFIRPTLELGGKSPNIVFDDADIAYAAMGVVAGIFAAGGPDLRRRQPGVRAP